MTGPVRVAVVEGDPRYRAVLERLFGDAAAFDLAGSFDHAEAALAGLVQGLVRDAVPPWDVVAVDADLPGMGGIEAARRMKALAPELRVVLLTVFDPPESVAEVAAAAADASLVKRARAREILEAARPPRAPERGDRTGG